MLSSKRERSVLGTSNRSPRRIPTQGSTSPRQPGTNNDAATATTILKSTRPGLQSSAIPAAPSISTITANTTTSSARGASSSSIATHGCGGTLQARAEINVLSPRGGCHAAPLAGGLHSPRGLGEGEHGVHVASVKGSAMSLQATPRGAKEVDLGLKQIADEARVKGMRALLFDQFAAKDEFHVPSLPGNTRHGSTRYDDTRGMVQPQDSCQASAQERFVTTSGTKHTVAVSDASKRTALVEAKAARTQNAWAWAAHHQAQEEERNVQKGKRMGVL